MWIAGKKNLENLFDTLILVKNKSKNGASIKFKIKTCGQQVFTLTMTLDQNEKNPLKIYACENIDKYL